MNIFFITPYNSVLSERELSCTPSSINYASYIVEKLSQLEDTSIVILSTSFGIKNNYWFCKTVVNGNAYKEVYFSSVSSKLGKLAIRFNQCWIWLQILVFLIFKVGPNDKCVIYHDNAFSYIYNLYRKFIRCKMIGLVGELYSAVYDKGEKAIRDERNRLSCFDSYIFANHIMPTLLKYNKPYCVCYGNYKIDCEPKSQSNIINVLYAGKISSKDINDAFVALNASKELPKGYFLHIAGYGDPSDIEMLKSQIEKINKKRHIVKYEGNLSGQEYKKLLNNCHIGLCTRALRNELSNYCFPSKIMVYLTNNIVPVCPDIDTIRTCPFNEKLILCNELSPRSIKNAIINASSSIRDYSNESILLNMDNEFFTNLKKII